MIQHTKYIILNLFEDNKLISKNIEKKPILHKLQEAHERRGNGCIDIDNKEGDLDRDRPLWLSKETDFVHFWGITETSDNLDYQSR